MRIVLLVVSVALLAACGSGSKAKYQLDIGCTDDMREYRDERKQIVKEEKKKKEIKIEDCPTAE